MNQIIINVDMDGVLAAYNEEYLRLTGADPSEKGKVKADRLKAHPHFYRHLPMLPDAMKLWNFLKPYHPSVLSAQSNYVPASRQDKIEWCQEHLHLIGPKVIVVDYPNQKIRHCTPGAILIDDSAKNCAEWDKAGGVAILHKSADETIRKLKPLLNHVDTSHVTETFQQMEEPPTCSNLLETFDDLVDLT